VDARAALLSAADDEDPATRVHALEALASTFGAETGHVYMEALREKRYEVVRFAAVMAVGDCAYEPALPVLLEMAERAGPDKRVYCAVIYALHVLGNDDYTSDLGKLLFHREPEVRAEAARAIGKIGDPSGAGPLEALLADEPSENEKVRLQATASLAMLGETRYAHMLEAYARQPFVDLRLAAIDEVGRLRSPQLTGALNALLAEREPPRVRVAAAGALARSGHFDAEGYSLCVKALQNPERMLRRFYRPHREVTHVEVMSLQRLAALSLGWMNRDEAVNVLHPLLKSRDGAIRAAAAASLVRLLSAYDETARPPAEPEPAAKTPPEPTEPKRRKLHTAGGRD